MELLRVLRERLRTRLFVHGREVAMGGVAAGMLLSEEEVAGE